MTFSTRWFSYASYNVTWVTRDILNIFANEIFQPFYLRGRIGISGFAFFCIPSLIIFLLSGIPICFPFLPLRMVVGRGHIHSALDSISILEVVLLAPKTYFLLDCTCPFRFFRNFKAVGFSSGCSLGFFVGGIVCLLFLEEGFPSNNRWLGILSLNVPNSSGFIVSIYVREVNHNLRYIERGRALIHSLLCRFTYTRKSLQPVLEI